MMLEAAEESSWLCVCEPGWHCSTGQLDTVLASKYQIGLMPSGVGSVAATGLYPAAEKRPAQMSFDATSVVAAAGSASALYRHLPAAVLLAWSGSDAAAEEAERVSKLVGLMTSQAMNAVHALPDTQLAKAFLALVVSDADVADSPAALAAAAWGTCMTAVADADWHTLLTSPSSDLAGALVGYEGMGGRQGGLWEADAVSCVGEAAAATLMHTPCC